MMQFAGTLVNKNSQVLLVQESHTAANGLWSLPIGSLEKNETLAEGASRETKEETGYIVSLGKKYTLTMTGKELKCLSEFHNKQVTLTIFKAKITSGNLIPGDDLLDAKWFPVEKLNNLKLRGEWVKNFANDKS